ncbi:MAG: 1-deoxy-D-xylulose-5-phosphate reductoisomerase [Proteobacteria bacterium]|nr:MAG: 1-deoxy-D-xylulose-5-phosphate reductoisomerase [Pseudomonadota bacterium]QKK12526.1 MAG: 1-deoxy-D-xylulose-5-phosphate reductoisomerase [Pseudomonadota bacterium]
MIGVTVLGATGSIGRSTLDVMARHSDRFSVFALTANTSWHKLLELCRIHKPRYAVIADSRYGKEFEEGLKVAALPTQALCGADALMEVASAPAADYVMAAIVGSVGLPPTLAAARAGKRVMLANKESLVMAGSLFMEAVEQGGSVLLPIDSEHNALFQCLPATYKAGDRPAGVTKLVLTASGGPFQQTSLETLDKVTPAQAIAHPNWEMGRKISVDSATMMNKGLEVIEASWLFSMAWQQIEVVIHPQSVIHSMVHYEDGSVLAQLGNPDMRTPIAHALGWPERIASGVSTLDLLQIGKFTFEKPDPRRFPCLVYAYEALAAGGPYPALLNAANEIAVEAFLQGQLPFTDIPKVVASVLAAKVDADIRSLDGILETDRRGRELARRCLVQLLG